MAEEEQCIGKGVLVCRFGSHKHQKSSPNLTDRTDQAENKASPVNSEDYGERLLGRQPFWPPVDARGPQFASASLYCQVFLERSSPGVSKQI